MPAASTPVSRRSGSASDPFGNGTRRWPSHRVPRVAAPGLVGQSPTSGLTASPGVVPSRAMGTSPLEAGGPAGGDALLVDHPSDHRDRDRPHDHRSDRAFDLYHPQSIVLNPHTSLGSDCHLRHGVTIGNTVDRAGVELGIATVGDYVDLGAGCGSSAISTSVIIRGRPRCPSSQIGFRLGGLAGNRSAFSGSTLPILTSARTPPCLTSFCNVPIDPSSLKFPAGRR